MSQLSRHATIVSAMKIEQRKLSNVHTFTFLPQKLTFSYHDQSGSGEVDIPYLEFPLKSSTRIVRNTWLRNIGYLWCAVGFLQLGIALSATIPATAGTLWLLLGIGCLLWAHATTVRYTRFAARSGSAWSIQRTTTHDQIANEIHSRRKERLRSIYGEINPDNDVEYEIEKFRWLTEQQALSVDEAEHRISELRGSQDEAKEQGPFDIN